MNEKLISLLREASINNSFYRSLYNQHCDGKVLSDRQMFFVLKLDPNSPSDLLDATIKIRRGFLSRLRKKGHDDLFVFNKVVKVHKETNKAVLVDLSPIRSLVGQCGRCGLTLTDEVSRAVSFGSTCSQYLGLKRSSKTNAETINNFLEKFFANKKPIEQIWLPRSSFSVVKENE